MTMTYCSLGGWAPFGKGTVGGRGHVPDGEGGAVLLNMGGPKMTFLRPLEAPPAKKIEDGWVGRAHICETTACTVKWVQLGGGRKSRA